MPPRKATANAPSDTTTPSTISTKRKIDWSTIDEPDVFEGFTLTAVTSNKRRKTVQSQTKETSGTTNDAGIPGYGEAPLSANIVQSNPFPEAALSQSHYAVEPAHVWESTKRYRKFTISEAEFEVGQCVFIEKQPEKQDVDGSIQHWVGQVLEVRAGDASHVYLRVYWFYRPEDLPGGRQPHHGECELVASNHMDIIEALSVSDKADVKYWDEDPEKPWPLKQQLFWRQSFDLQTTRAKQFSPIRKICVDRAPCNPDEPLVQCPSCLVWLHAQCLEDRAVRDAAGTHSLQTKMSATRGKKKRGRPSSSSEPPPFTAYLSTLGESGTTYLTVTDHRPGESKRRFNVDIKCLKCNAVIESAPEEIPPEPPTTTNFVIAVNESNPLLQNTDTPLELAVEPSPKLNGEKIEDSSSTMFD
ncbi:hypothetical protein DE146DRAFT_606612 [Phaeosphaeria sp. MPI-PUGE-AT-0046c]|nr:hypothetical protein DE146DRAFT_606612 [Phaeosphaeria sp. MPI-PUGE-AT-0046c]